MRHIHNPHATPGVSGGAIYRCRGSKSNNSGSRRFRCAPKLLTFLESCGKLGSTCSRPVLTGRVSTAWIRRSKAQQYRVRWGAR